jgi:hypothetical protein
VFGYVRQGITRRSLLLRASLGLGAVGLAARPAHAKISKAAAAYQPTPNGAQSCARCAYCQGGDGCMVVEGPISPSGWCRLFLKP